MIRRDFAWRAPLDAFAPLATEPYAALLHAGEASADPGWSILAAFPEHRLEAREGRAFLDGAACVEGPFAALRSLTRGRNVRIDGRIDTPFATGAIGFLGYEMGTALEPSAKGPSSPFALPDMAFGVYDAAALFDRKAKRAFIAARTERAADRLLEAMGEGAASATDAGDGALASNFAKADYESAVAEVIERIRDGALFQANISQQLSAPFRGDAFALYRRLMTGDSRFGAFLPYAEGAIASSSPERFFKVSASGPAFEVLCEPIKGTRPRGAMPDEDARLAAELCADPKERAENIMIADLFRNDLSRVAADGGVREEAICALETQASVHHLVSRISATLRPGLGPVDVLEALFPSGSVTGAPKVEAMKLIAEIEKVGRGPYCGAIGYIGDDGRADFSVAIRTMIIEGARATFPVGGGVTLRSDPAREYEETLVKARAMRAALGADATAAA